MSPAQASDRCDWSRCQDEPDIIYQALDGGLTFWLCDRHWVHVARMSESERKAAIKRECYQRAYYRTRKEEKSE